MSLLTHPPQPLVSQHNGWMITPHKNQSDDISLAICWAIGVCTQPLKKHIPSKNQQRQNTNKYTKSCWKKRWKQLKKAQGLNTSTKQEKIKTSYLGVGWSLYLFGYSTPIFIPCLLAHTINRALPGSRSASPPHYRLNIRWGGWPTPISSRHNRHTTISIHYMHWLSIHLNRQKESAN